MSLPSSGQITLDNFRAEMSQSTTSNYGFDGAFYGFQYPDFFPSIPWYSPINVHSDNADNFETNQYNWYINTWYGYNNSAYYSASSTPRPCYFNIQPNQTTASYATAMIVIHVGTNSGVVPIRISGSANDFSSAGITTASIWYGKPWSSSGTGSGFNNADLILMTSSNQFQYDGLDISPSYNYTYNASYGEYLYCIIHNNPPQPAIVPCGTTITYTGGQAYPSVGAKVVGTGTGSVSIEFDAFSVPDRFILYWGDNSVIDTGYRGYGPAYDYGQYLRGDFTSSLNGLVDPLTGLTYPNNSIPSIAPDGYPYVSATGQGTSSFQKTTNQPITTTTKVYAPMAGTAWNYKVGCPV
jgi:hypothetical protein